LEADPPDTLAAALARHAIELPSEQREMLDRYAGLLWDWNAKLNLTRHTDYERIVTRDVVDSLALSVQLPAGRRVLDVGSGGGVPGVILAVTRPDLKLTLCESTAKKHRALADIVARLGLPVEVFHARAEELLEARRFDQLVARAVAPLPKLLYWLAPHWSSFDELLIIKGPSWPAERDEAGARGLLENLDVNCAATYRTPVTGAENVVLRIEQAAPEA
jgi:16S rRNA (guanine527-N7)-methyltransferase